MTEAAHSSPEPLPIALLSQRGWPPAAQFFWARIADIEGIQLGDLAADYWSRDKGRCKDACHTLADLLFAAGHGAEGLAALMLAADPAEPMTFEIVLPQLAYAIEHLWDFPADVFARQHALRRLAVWWRAARGDFKDNAASIFWLTGLEVLGEDASSEEPTPVAEPNGLAQQFVPEQPSIVVMQSGMSTKLNNYHSEFKDLIDARLPLRLARNVDAVRKTLIAEYPHAGGAIDLVMRELREGQPVRWAPILLVGAPGVGKSHLVRRLAHLLRIGVYLYDGSGASDAMFGGSPKAWGNTTASAPARAVNQMRIANPLLVIEELEKCSTSSTNGRLWDVLLLYLDRRTAASVRDVSLDSVLDLSGILYIATANSIENLPAPLQDRFRIIRVPEPRLADLPQLAANVMQELADEAGEPGFVWPLAGDELTVIGRAWEKAGFSIRNLERIVKATIEVRNITAVRH